MDGLDVFLPILVAWLDTRTYAMHDAVARTSPFPTPAVDRRGNIQTFHRLERTD